MTAMTDKNQDSRVYVYESKLYIITAKTNMHVGSGETSLGLVDNRVQRDVLTNLPNINASGLKGALREYYSHLKGKKDDEWIIDTFGSDSSASKDKKPEERDHRAGKFRFFNANLLSIPVRSNVRPYFHVTSPEVLKDFVDGMETFDYPAPAGLKESLSALVNAFDAKKNKEENWVFTQSGSGTLVLEDFENVQEKTLEGIDLNLMETFLGKPLALMNHEDFKDICSDYNLPLIARNNLENGRSKNLWHEQVVPRESRFYFFLLKPVKETVKDLEFRDNVPVQIGGNASIGYGFTIIKEAADFKTAVPVERVS